MHIAETCPARPPERRFFVEKVLSPLPKGYHLFVRFVKKLLTQLRNMLRNSIYIKNNPDLHRGCLKSFRKKF